MKLSPKVFAVAFIVALLASAVAAKPKCKKQSVADLVNAFADSFANKSMGSLDVDHPYVGTIRFVIEH